MPRRFRAPIPLANPWIVQARKGPVSRDPRDILDELAVRNGLLGVPPEHNPLPEWLELGEGPARIAYTNLFAAFEVVRLVDELVEFYKMISPDVADDALVVDDYSLLTFSAVKAMRDIAALSHGADRVRIAGRDKIGLGEDMDAWMEQEPSIIRDRETQAAAMLDGAPDHPCLHMRPHDRMGKRGRKATVPIRIASWATYILSWVTGNETLAVRIWNSLLLPREYRWTPGAYDSGAGLDYAVKKYLDAKNRLARDIIGEYACVNPMTFQGILHVVPDPPLDRDTSNLVLWILKTKLRWHVDALSGTVSKWTPLEATVLSSSTTAPESATLKA